MKKSFSLLSVLFVITFSVFNSCSTSVDINNEEAVLKDIQGTWIVCHDTGKAFRHIKLIVSDNLFEGWINISDSKNEPNWATIPDEKGFLTLSSLLSDKENKIIYRKFALTCAGRCCGDISLSIKTLTDLISYQEGKGLIVDGKVKMSKKK